MMPIRRSTERQPVGAQLPEGFIAAPDIGEPSCRTWRSVPRLGLVGMLMGWWRVKLSSGCPLAAGAGGVVSCSAGARRAGLAVG